MHGSVPIQVDVLPRLRQLLLQWPGLAGVCEPPPEIHAVFDTNVIIEDLRFLAIGRRDSKARTALQELLASGIIVGHFPAEAVGEVEAKLDELSGRYGIPREALALGWLHYRNALQISSTCGLTLSSDEMSLRDPTDLPFLRLQRLVGAHVIFSYDKDLLVIASRAVPPLRIRVELQELARAHTLYLSTVIGGALTISVGLIGVIELVRAVVRLLGVVPRGVHLAVFAVAVAVIATPSWRSAVVGRCSRFANCAGEILTAAQPILMALAQQTADAHRRSQESWQRVSLVFPISGGPGVERTAYLPSLASGIQDTGLTQRRTRYGNQKIRWSTSRRRLASESARLGSGKLSSLNARGGRATRERNRQQPWGR